MGDQISQPKRKSNNELKKPPLLFAAALGSDALDEDEFAACKGSEIS